MSAAPAAPTGLNAAGKRLWASLHEDGLRYRPDELTLIAHACRTEDLCVLLERAAKGKTLVPGSKGQLVVNPALQELRQSRQLLSTLLGRLSIPEAEDPQQSMNFGENVVVIGDGTTPSSRARAAARARHDRRGA